MIPSDRNIARVSHSISSGHTPLNVNCLRITHGILEKIPKLLFLGEGVGERMFFPEPKTGSAVGWPALSPPTFLRPPCAGPTRHGPAVCGALRLFQRGPEAQT